MLINMISFETNDMPMIARRDHQSTLPESEALLAVTSWRAIGAERIDLEVRGNLRTRLNRERDTGDVCPPISFFFFSRSTGCLRRLHYFLIYFPFVHDNYR